MQNTHSLEATDAKKADSVRCFGSRTGEKMQLRLYNSDRGRKGGAGSDVRPRHCRTRSWIVRGKGAGPWLIFKLTGQSNNFVAPWRFPYCDPYFSGGRGRTLVPGSAGGDRSGCFEQMVQLSFTVKHTQCSTTSDACEGQLMSRTCEML